MRTIIAGSRDFSNYRLLCQSMNTLDWPVTAVLSGTARGADRLGELWATDNDIPLETYPADWEKYPRFAGYKRNEVMANRADALVAFWDGASKGTAHMIKVAGEVGLQHIKVFYIKDAFISDDWIIKEYDPNYRTAGDD